MSIERWEIDSSQSGIHFSVRHLLISKVRGRFGRWSGTLHVRDGDWSHAKVEVIIDASSIETGIGDRDAHLRAADYLDVKRYPDISFRARHVTAAVNGRRKLSGTLTIKGRSREVTLEVEDKGVRRDPWGNERAGFSAKVSFDRRHFGVTGSPPLNSGVVIGERIDVEVQVEAVRQAAPTRDAATEPSMAGSR